MTLRWRLFAAAMLLSVIAAIGLVGCHTNNAYTLCNDTRSNSQEWTVIEAEWFNTGNPANPWAECKAVSNIGTYDCWFVEYLTDQVHAFPCP